MFVVDGGGCLWLLVVVVVVEGEEEEEKEKKEEAEEILEQQHLPFPSIPFLKTLLHTDSPTINLLAILLTIPTSESRPLS